MEDKQVVTFNIDSHSQDFKTYFLSHPFAWKREKSVEVITTPEDWLYTWNMELEDQNDTNR